MGTRTETQTHGWWAVEGEEVVERKRGGRGGQPQTERSPVLGSARVRPPCPDRAHLPSRRGTYTHIVRQVGIAGKD